MSATASRALLVRHRSVAADRARFRRTVLLSLIAACAAMAGIWWMVTGPPGRISSVSVTGYDGPNAAVVEDLITRVAKRGSVVDPPETELRQAVEGFPWVADLRVQRKLPKGVVVVVVSATPGAIAVPDRGEAMVLSAAGRVLGPLAQKGSLAVPRVRVGATKLATGGVIAGPLVTATLALSAHLSPQVAGRLVALKQRRGGLVGTLSNGPEVRFGLMQDLPAKAEALDLVLGQMSPQEERAAAYIDVAVPWFPAVGDRAEEPSTTP